MHASGRRYILGVMDSLRQLQRYLPSSGSGSRVREKLIVTALLTRGPSLATIVLSLAIVAQAIVIALTLAGEVSADSRARIPVSARVHDPHRAALTDITAAHLFGNPPEDAKADEARTVSRAPLILTGVIATGDPHDGFAIVGTSADSTRAIYVGSEAAPGTVLIKVFPLWVVLQRGPQRLTLRLTRKDLLSGVVRTAFRGIRGGDSEPVPEATDDSGGGVFAMPAALQRPPVTDDAAVLNSFALVSARTVQGQDGMRIAGTAFNKQSLAALGLHSGDVIVEVNGAPIGSPNGDLNRALRSGSTTLTVDRRGEDTSVMIDATTLASAAAIYRQTDPDL